MWVMCASSPVYPVIIGNVRGSQRMLPDPDWRAEDQPRVQARTSGGNKDKDIDDDQGGDIYVLGCLRRNNQVRTGFRRIDSENSFDRVGKPIISLRESC